MSLVQRSNFEMPVKPPFTFIRIEPGRNRIQFIGLPYGYKEHTAYEAELRSSRRGERVSKPFIDEEQYRNRKFTRICAEEHCVWCELGYHKIQKFASVVVKRQPNNDFDYEIGVLCFGKELISSIMQLKDALSDDKSEKKANPRSSRVVITPVQPSFSIYPSTYTVLEDHACPKVDKHLKKALYDIYRPTRAEIVALEMSEGIGENYPDWFYSGPQLDKLFAPTICKLSAEELSLLF